MNSSKTYSHFCVGKKVTFDRISECVQPSTRECAGKSKTLKAGSLSLSLWLKCMAKHNIHPTFRGIFYRLPQIASVFSTMHLHWWQDLKIVRQQIAQGQSKKSSGHFREIVSRESYCFSLIRYWKSLDCSQVHRCLWGSCTENSFCWFDKMNCIDNISSLCTERSYIQSYIYLSIIFWP